jgi:dihydrofolate reductase
MRISLVVAASENDVIGADGGIPWRLPDDQQFFKHLTLGHHIVMGRRTYESIGRLLPGRSTIIVSSNRAYAVDGAVVAHSLDDALDHARERDDDEVFIVGGASLYRLGLPIADRLHLTRVHAEVAGDAGFPDRVALRAAGWKLIDEQAHAADDRHDHAFTIQCWERSDTGES